MSEKRESEFSTVEKMCLWNSPSERYPTGHCRAAIHVSMGYSLSLSRPLEFIVGLFAPPVLPGSRIAAFSVRQRRRRKQASDRAYVAGRRRPRIWLRGAERQAPSPVRLHSLRRALLTAMARASRRWRNASASESATCGACSFNIWVHLPSPWHRLGVCFLPSNSFMKRECP